jgi:triosephosphate isomerase (TIM)
MSRIPLVVGNWKLYKTISETADFCRLLKEELSASTGASALRQRNVEVAVAPPFTSLSAAADVLQGSFIGVSSQDAFWAENGAYTGEVSPKMLADAGCRWAIIGHSERRQFFHETDESVNKKAAALIAKGLVPIVCVGESLKERQEGRAFEVVERQLRAGLKDLAVGGAAGLVIAYEPVWAIGTGQTATPQQAQEMHLFIRELLRKIFSPGMAEEMRVLYGGSVKPDNIGELMAMKDVDGALVGGASLEVKSFSRIVTGCLPTK